MIKKLYRDVKLKDGTVLKKGSLVRVNVALNKNVNFCTVITEDDQHYNLHITSVFKAPGVKTMQKWIFDSAPVKSISGKICDPDGFDEKGYPSWLLVLGMI